MERLVLLLKSVLAAEKKVGLMLNVSKTNLDAVIARLPALHKPTLSPLADSGWVALMAVIDETVVRDLIPALQEAGAQGIVEFGLNKVVPDRCV